MDRRYESCFMNKSHGIGALYYLAGGLEVTVCSFSCACSYLLKHAPSLLEQPVETSLKRFKDGVLEEIVLDEDEQQLLDAYVVMASVTK
ncbi:hypothetical protein ACX93W_01825 [Paenibacillus sp. CAU 1782]